MCKVGSGYKMKELYDLNVHLNKSPLVKASRPPDWLKCGSEKATVYLDPKQSRILQVSFFFLFQIIIMYHMCCIEALCLSEV